MATLTVKRAPASAHQLEMGQLIVQTTRGRGGDTESIAGAIATAIQESSLTNIKGGDRDSAGLYQQRPSMGWGTYAQVTTPSYAINKFLDTYLPYRKQGMGWLQASHKTQRSAYPSAPAAWYSEGVAFATGVAGAVAGATSADGQEVVPYEFSRGEANGKKEDSWTCMGRLADEVQWRRFVSGVGELWYVSDDWIAKQAPVYRISETATGVLSLSFQFETRQEAAECTVRVATQRYDMTPGMVVKVVDEGPADGDWIVASVRRELLSYEAEVNLTRKRPKLEEPAPQTRSVSVDGSDSAIGGAGQAPELSQVKLDGRWGGCQSVFEQFITGFLRSKGYGRVTSRKRHGSGGSDHNYSSTNAYAEDYGTYSGHAGAAALDQALGGVNYKQNTYNTGQFSAGGGRFRCQILWGAAIAHGDHIHVGLRRA